MLAGPVPGAIGGYRSDMRTLDGRVAIVTGASSGIGRAVAYDLCREGACVVINARRRGRLDDFQSEVAGHLGDDAADRIAVCAGDASEPDTIEAMFTTAWESFESEADLVVVNAGRGLRGSVLTSDEDEWREMIETNYIGAARLMRAAALRMIQDLEQETNWQQAAHDIVVLGSNVGRHISPFSSMYGSTKFAVHALTEALRRELAPQGIRVTLIEPGIVSTEFQQVAGYDDSLTKGFHDKFGPLLTPDDVARCISFATGLPPQVHLCDMLIRPTRQEYP